MFCSSLAVGHCTRLDSALLNVGLSTSPHGEPAFRLGDRLAAGHGEHLCGDVAGLLGGEEDVGRRDLRRLPSASQRCALAMACAFSVGMVAGISGVQIGPGATAFTRMPFFRQLLREALVKLWMAALVVA